MKQLDTRAYVSALRELTEAGHTVPMVIAGSSMAPFLIHQRDTIWFKKPDRPLKRGDMVFYQRSSGKFIMHRIYRIENEQYYMIGDNQYEIEGPLDRGQIFGLVTQVQRKGRIIRPGDFWWEFFARVWLRVIPLRRVIAGVYAALSRLLGRKELPHA